MCPYLLLYLLLFIRRGAMGAIYVAMAEMNEMKKVYYVGIPV